jgi:glycosyltransferase involved in cell wall biosynthesis
MYSVVILTLNEERALPGCLASLRGCNDIVLLDSGSTDGTVRLAEGAGARVFTRPFDTFAGQRNHAQQCIEFRNPWVFHLDADERMTPGLHDECERASSRADLDGSARPPDDLRGPVDPALHRLSRVPGAVRPRPRSSSSCRSATVSARRPA